MEQTTLAATMLQRLGNTADEVAAALRARGVRGVRHAVRFLNPIVRYLQTEIGGTSDMNIFKVDQLSITFPDSRKADVPLPPAVQDFLDAFNRQAYPDLELPVGPL